MPREAHGGGGQRPQHDAQRRVDGVLARDRVDEAVVLVRERVELIEGLHAAAGRVVAARPVEAEHEARRHRGHLEPPAELRGHHERADVLVADLAELIGRLELGVEAGARSDRGHAAAQRMAMLAAARAVHDAVVALDREPVEVAARIPEQRAVRVDAVEVVLGAPVVGRIAVHEDGVRQESGRLPASGSSARPRRRRTSAARSPSRAGSRGAARRTRAPGARRAA